MIDSWTPIVSIRAESVNHSTPGNLTQVIVLAGPLSFEGCLGTTVTALLTPIPSKRFPWMMPNNSRGAEADLPATIPDSPTDIDIVPGSVKPGIKTLDFF
jgi:hypothetical protein